MTFTPVNDAGTPTDERATALAQAELDRRAADEVVLRGTATGHPRLRPGAIIDVGPNVTDIAIAGASVWTAAASTGVLQRISPRTDTIVQTVRLDRPIGGIAADHERIWITVR